MGSATVKGASNSSISRLLNKFLWQRVFDSIIKAICYTPFGSETSVGWLHWISQYWKVFDHKHFTQESCVQNGANTRRDKDLAIHNFNTKDISYRLSRSCSSKS